MKLIGQDFFIQVYADKFEGHEVIWRRNVFSGELTLQLTDEVARLFGFDNVEQMMLNDEVLDRLNDCYRRTGIFPLTRI